MTEPTFRYDKEARRGVITFPNGHELKIGNVDEDKAKAFYEKHAAEFMKRDCVLHTSACVEVRSHG